MIETTVIPFKCSVCGDNNSAALSFLLPELGQEPCGVTVGVGAGNANLERLTECFRGLVDVRPTSYFGSAAGCEALFRQGESRQDVEVLLPLGDDQSREHRILMSVAASPFPSLDSVAYAVLAPAFASGGIGVDWDDVCSILRSGTRAVLVVGESSDAVLETLRLAESALAAHDRIQVSGVIAAAFAPQGAHWGEAVRQLGRAAESLAPHAWQLVAAPIILGDTPVCSVLAVFPE